MLLWIFRNIRIWLMENIIFYPLVLVIDLYCFSIRRHNYWKKRGVPFIPPKFHYGNMKPFWDGKQSLPELSRAVYGAFPDSRFVGYYQFNLPMLMLRDYDLIQKITFRDSIAFPEHRMFASPSADPLWAKNIFAMEGGPSWKEIRTAAIYSFSDEKLKIMFNIVDKCATRFVDFFMEEDVSLTMEATDTFNRVTNDIIAATIFGHPCDSLRDRKNEFYAMVHEAVDISGKRYDFFMASIHPALPKWYDVRFISPTTTKYFKKIVEDAIDSRDTNHTCPQDIISELMAFRGRKEEITNEVITAIAVEFFIAGFDTTSRAMTFTAYELACNHAIQETLRAEIDRVFENNDKITYDVIKNMKYMDMVVLETLRKWPPFAVTDRKLKIPSYVIDPVGDETEPVHLQGDMVCIIPIFAIHRDPKLYPNPDVFNPDRFLDLSLNVNIRNFFPFGDGVRKCIGNRFALLEIKTVMLYLLRKFRIEVIENVTQVPLVLCKRHVNLVPDGGVWLRFAPRQDF